MLESELFALLEQTADAAYAVTDAGEICSWNGAAERLFGYPAGEVLRRNIDEVLEASDAVGGRVRTDLTPEGFRLDRGFQVLLTNYPETKRLLDYEALNLQKTFLAETSHELRTPLTALHGYLRRAEREVGGSQTLQDASAWPRT